LHPYISGDKYTNFGEMSTWMLVCQSTLDTDFWEAVENLCDQKNFFIKSFDTICGATKQSQLCLWMLESCDAVIVVGGKHS
jgi:4-hydroxy-3-methylbut-2-enyl diphosphate reductase IspH